MATNVTTRKTSGKGANVKNAPLTIEELDNNLIYLINEIENDTATNSTFYPALLSSTTGNAETFTVSDTNLSFNPSTGELSSDGITTNNLKDGSGRTLVIKDSTGTVVWG